MLSDKDRDLGKLLGGLNETILHRLCAKRVSTESGSGDLGVVGELRRSPSLAGRVNDLCTLVGRLGVVAAGMIDMLQAGLRGIPHLESLACVAS